MRVIVCGSRTWNDGNAVERVLLENLPNGEAHLVIHGGARGADTLAHHACHKLGVPVEVHKANWTLHGKAAGPIRNREMLRRKPDLVIAFRSNGRSPGTDHMVAESRRQGVPVKVIC